METPETTRIMNTDSGSISSASCAFTPTVLP